MTDQERPSDPESQPTTPSTPPDPEQPTVGWTAPPPPSSAPVPSGWGGQEAAPPPPPPAPDPSQPGWGAPPPPPPAPDPAQPGWGAPPPPPPPAGGPLLSATPSASSGWTPPTAGGPEVAPGLTFSGTAARFVAYLVDGFLLAVVSGVVASIFGVSSFATRSSLTPGDVVQAQSGGGFIIATLISVAINAAYFILFWSGGRRATLGQMLFKIQVGNAFDGKPLTTNQAVKRWFGLGEFLQAFSFSAGAAGALAGLGLLWSLVLLITTATSPTKQGLHDKFANSAVVRPVGASNTLVWTCLFIAIGLFIVLPILAILALFSLGGQVSTILSAVGESV